MSNISPRTQRAFQTKLVRWFERNQRTLPWRKRRTPYRVWISELMLQQTRVDQVIPYYQRFMKRCPSLRSFADASRHDVLKLWEGLGYYARARNAHDAAKLIVREYGGRFPRTFEELQALPGVGRYTAAAIGSFSFGLDVAVVDGNVIRVLTRVMGYDRDSATTSAKRQFQLWADELLIPGKAGVSNEALMELGAICCTPRNPSCPVCPLRGVCVACSEGRPERYPVKKRKKRVPHKTVGAGLIVNARGRVLIAQRRETSMLGGLWEFPGGTKERGETMVQCIERELQEELGITTKVGQRLMIVRHAYSHFTIALHAHWARILKGRPRLIHCADYAWVTLGELRDYPFSGADIRIIEKLEELGRIPKAAELS